MLLSCRLSRGGEAQIDTDTASEATESPDYDGVQLHLDGYRGVWSLAAADRPPPLPLRYVRRWEHSEAKSGVGRRMLGSSASRGAAEAKDQTEDARQGSH